MEKIIIIKTIMPAPDMNAVYYNYEDKVIERSSIIALALVKKPEGDYISAMDFDVDGMFGEANDAENFLGLELKGTKKEWKEEILSYIQDRLDLKSKKE